MSKIRTIAVLSLSYFIGELAHWLPVTTSKSLANAMQFGEYNETCLESLHECSTNTTLTCESNCYTGKGTDVQAIFAFYFILPISVTTLVFGFLADFPFRLKLLAGALGILSVAQVGIGLSSSYHLLVAMRILIGAAEGAFQPIAGAVISNTFGELASRGMAIFNWGIYLGFASSFLLAQIFENVEPFGWRISYVLTGVVGVILVPAVLFLVKVNTPICTNSQ